MIDLIQESILSRDSGLLLIAAFVFVGRYLIIFFLIYLGAWILCMAVSTDKYPWLFPLCYILLTTMELVFFNEIYQEHFAFQTHFLIIGLITLLQVYLPYQKYYYFIVSLVLIFVIFAIQWLQLIPALSVLGFGTNDIAVSVKVADKYITDHSLLNTMATIFFAAFLVMAIILTLLFHLQRKQVDTLKKFEVQGKELKETKVALVESKVYEEIATLVHDLKTPLVSVEGLMSLIEMKMADYSNTAMGDYFRQIDDSIGKMKDMISEILYEQKKKLISPRELLEYVVSHLNLSDKQIQLKIDVTDHIPPLFVNKIRFSRAISNLLENAIGSFNGNEGYIRVDVKKVDDMILIQITDNGPGIPQEDLDHIWKDGFSTKNSSGIGLSFVKRVVENHGGTISVNTSPHLYTQMDIYMPIGTRIVEEKQNE